MRLLDSQVVHQAEKVVHQMIMVDTPQMSTVTKLVPGVVVLNRRELLGQAVQHQSVSSISRGDSG